MSVRLGVLGWPVAHSRSPAMQNAALAHLGLTHWRYQRLPVPPGLFAETVRALPAAGFLGANVTIPHKQAALELATSASEEAREIGAANTLTFTPEGEIAAANTDAPGVLEALGVSPRGMRAQVLGAGGSARAVVWALLRAGAAEVWVWNRTPERAATLARGARGVGRRATPGRPICWSTAPPWSCPARARAGTGARNASRTLGHGPPTTQPSRADVRSSR